MKHWLTRLVKYWFIVVTVTLAGVTHAAYNPPMNLSNNNNNDTYFWIINNGDVVWSGFEGVDWDLWKYSAAANTTTQITNTSTVDEYVASANDSGSLLWIQWNNLTTTSDLMLAVSGNMQNTRKLNAKPLCSLYNSPNTLNSYGDVIWMEADALSTSCDIYLFNATTLTTTNISNSPYRDDSPLFYKGRDILWQQVVSSSFQYLLYNVATGTVTNLTTSYGVTGISERNDRGDIVWDNGATTTDAFISVYTAATNSVTTIASTVGNGLVDSIPKISPTGNIIWRQLGGPGAGASLYFKTPTGQPILIGDMGGMMTGQFMFNGDILYLGRDPVGLDYEVYIYSPTTGVNKNISNNTFDELMVWANVNGDVTWQSGGSGSAGPVDGDIFVYQAATGIVDRLTNNATADNFPVIINNGRVVWVGYDGVDSEIFYAIPATSLALEVLFALAALRKQHPVAKFVWQGIRFNFQVGD